MDEHDPLQDPDDADPPASLPRWSGLVHGMEMALYVLVLGALGWLGDGALGIRDAFPALTVLGVLAGFAYGIWRAMRALGRRPPPPR